MLRATFLGAFAAVIAAATPPIPATDLRTEYLVEPPNIDTPAPRFYWQPQHADRGQYQTSYSIVVTDPTGKTVWDSGNVASNASTHVAYAGSALTSNTCYSWTVAWADSTGAWAPASSPATFCMGLLTQAEWVSDWITCPQAPTGRSGAPYNQIRTEVTLKAGVSVSQARVYITGVGYYRAFVNGRKLGQSTVLDPAWSTYPIRSWYSAYDVTSFVLAGAANAIAVYLGNGWADVSPNPFNGSTALTAEWLRSVLPADEAAAVLAADGLVAGAGPDTDWSLLSAGLTRLRTREGLSEEALANLRWDVTGAVPKVRAQLHVTYADGTADIFTTSAPSFEPSSVDAVGAAASRAKDAQRNGATPAAWVCGSGALVSNSVYGGCTWDARYETLGWDVPGYNTTGWLPATLAADPGGAQGPTTMSAQMFYPIDVIQEMHPLSLNEPAPGTYVLDFGQNFQGIVRLTLDAPLPAGLNITLRHAELLTHPPYGPVDGSIYVGNLRSAQATDVFTTRATGSGSLILEPMFTFHGFRYVEVTGLPFPPTLEAVTGLFLRSALPLAGNVAFPSTAHYLNSVQRAAQWGIGSNLNGVISDCCQRDERKGWMGDSSLTVETLALNYDACAFFSGWVQSIRDSQINKVDGHPAGSLADTTPHTFGSYPSDPAWGTAYPANLWMLWKSCGDTRTIADHYPALLAYMTFMEGCVNQTGLKNLYYHYGDWVPAPAVPGTGQGPKPPQSMTSSYAFLKDVLRVVDLATALGKPADAAYYSAYYTALTAEYNAAFFSPALGIYGNLDGGGLQSAHAASIGIGVVPPASADKVLGNFVNDIMQTHGGHWDAGISGTFYFHRALTAGGRGDVALHTLLDDTYPSFGYWWNNAYEPATTFWELPDGDNEGPGMNSRNHHMFASVGAFLFDLAGLQQPTSASAAGWTNALLWPTITDQPALPFASGSIATLAGTYQTAWTNTSGTLCADQVPENTVQTLTCPGGANNVITAIAFASFGTADGSCGNYSVDASCNAANSTTIVSGMCLGKHSCAVNASDKIFGDPCYGVVKHLDVQVSCALSAFTFDVSVPTNARATVLVPYGAGGSAAAVTVTEGPSGATVWSSGQYTPGVPGVTGAADNAAAHAIAVTVGSGSYSFAAA